jgi:hypothetical protein
LTEWFHALRLEFPAREVFGFSFAVQRLHVRVGAIVKTDIISIIPATVLYAWWTLEFGAWGAASAATITMIVQILAYFLLYARHDRLRKSSVETRQSLPASSRTRTGDTRTANHLASLALDAGSPGRAGDVDFTGLDRDSLETVRMFPELARIPVVGNSLTARSKRSRQVLSEAA